MSMKRLSATEALSRIGVLLVLCVLAVLASCSKDTEVPDEYDNWEERNTT